MNISSIFLEKLNQDLLLIVGITLTTAIITWLFASIYWYQKSKKAQNQAIKKSRSVIIGQVTEQIAPLLKNFPFNPKDMVFLGK